MDPEKQTYRGQSRGDANGRTSRSASRAGTLNILQTLVATAETDVEIARTAAREFAQAADHDFNIAALGLNRHIAFDEGNDIRTPCARGLPEHKRQSVPGAHHIVCAALAVRLGRRHRARQGRQCSWDEVSRNHQRPGTPPWPTSTSSPSSSAWRNSSRSPRRLSSRHGPQGQRRHQPYAPRRRRKHVQPPLRLQHRRPRYARRRPCARRCH